MYLYLKWKLIKYTDYELKSNTIGRNQIQVDVKANINAYAQMISTLDSTTKKDDEILVQPVLPSLGVDDRKIFNLSGQDWDFVTAKDKNTVNAILNPSAK